MASTPAEQHPTRFTWIIRALPWLVTVACITYIVLTTDLDLVVDALRQADILAFSLTAVVLSALLFAVDTAGIWAVISWFHAPIRFTEVLPVRGSSYLLGIINYNAGSAAMALYLKRTRDIPAIECFGSLFSLTLIDLALVAVFVAVGGEIQGLATLAIRITAAAIVVGLVLFWVIWKSGIALPLVGRMRLLAFFRTFTRAGLGHYGRMFLMRLPVLALYVLFHYLTLLCFGMHIPLAPLLVYVPIQMLVAALPISIAGIGTVQMAQRVLYAPYAAQTLIDAYGATLMLGFLVPRLVIGLGYVWRASRELGQPTAGRAFKEGDR